MNANIITSIMSGIFFIFCLAAVWFGKMPGSLLLAAVPIAAGLIAFKNKGLKDFIMVLITRKKV